MTTLICENVTYQYEKGSKVLEHITTQFETGKMYAILGASGSGKTTLLSLIGGLDIPQEGKIMFHDRDISEQGLEYHRRNHVSVIFQNYNLIDRRFPPANQSQERYSGRWPTRMAFLPRCRIVSCLLFLVLPLLPIKGFRAWRMPA